MFFNFKYIFPIHRLLSSRFVLRRLAGQRQRHPVLAQTPDPRSGYVTGILGVQLPRNRSLRFAGHNRLYYCGHQPTVDALHWPFARMHQLLHHDGLSTRVQCEDRLNACIGAGRFYWRINDRTKADSVQSGRDSSEYFLVYIVFVYYTHLHRPF